jgi:superfamily I DNA/RNA helicase
MRQAWKFQDRWVQGIPYEVFGGTEFYERKEVKDLCAYLRVIVNSLDQEALLRIVNQPRRGIGEDSLDVLTAYNRQSERPLWEVLEEVANQKGEGSKLIYQGKAFKGICEFVGILQEAKNRFQHGNLAENLKWLIEQTQYQKAIKEEVKSQQMRDFKWENVQAFISSLAEFEQQAQSNADLDASLEAFLGGLHLDNQFMQSTKNRTEDRVNLLTFHSAKGLEFPVCFLVGMEDHIIPHEKSMKETGIEEERRLMYVAITRAQQHLTISMAQQRKRMGKEMASRPSRFLFEIPKELLNVTDWRSI